MEPIKRNDTGAAVEDVQTRLARIGHLPEDAITGIFDDATAAALAEFLAASALPPSEEVTEKVWAALVDATYNLGDRTLYLRMPYFHGHDVQLQQALGALGFFYGTRDAIFGAHTEEALRRFQLNLGLPSDGIAGAYTYAALRNLAHSWVGKEATHSPVRHLGFARAADVLERNAVCLFGTDEFSRAVASRMSNVAQATNPASKIISADALSVPPDASMMLVHVLLSATDAEAGVPLVSYAEEDTLGCVWPRPSMWPATRAGPACRCCSPAPCG
ncbi:MAG: peptidoglycan-binding domain-containing protein [Adlercreutzia equolifaciens]